MTTRASSSARQPLVSLAPRQWRSLMDELGRRGQGTREAGAFLLASLPNSRRVAHVEYFDDLDPMCLRGNIEIEGHAFSKLWDICEAKKLTVIADVHTHPYAVVQQSSIDKQNPMIARDGHVALIVPHFATRRVRPRHVGVHQYCGDGGWASWFRRDAARRLSVRRWT
ncbi:hypothetical protein [Candidatus Poriferisodalis sp.]|uniref:hypothetical protein n=1 Tax=Candidatus Poriferisodalis sp. TaxID=3101277 RepID=UPI003B52044B